MQKGPMANSDILPSKPIALTIAGSDPSGGAGIQADLKTFTVLGVYGAAVITALTAQSTRGVAAIHRVPAAFVAQQIDVLADDLSVGATKTGMLHDRATVLATAEAVRRHSLHPLVVDPVMVATSGDVLLEDDAIAAYLSDLIPLADVLTPNLEEAARLTGRPVARDEEQMLEQAQALQGLGCKTVVMKGGHCTGAQATDVFLGVDGQVLRLTQPRVATPNTHGTGCTFSAAMTASLARGRTMPDAVSDAKAFVHGALMAGRQLHIGHGTGPVDHLFRSDRRKGP